jgi:hypothetical protein
MFKSTFFLVLICILPYSYGQKNRFVENSALRIDYQVFVSHNYDSINIVSIHKVNDFAFNPNSLLDVFNYGVHRVEMYDSANHQLLYSKGFSSLYQEWQNTPEALDNRETFEMSFILPMPTKTVKLIHYNRNKENVFIATDTFYVSPRGLLCKPNIIKHPTHNIHFAGNSKKKFDLLIIPDGYSEKDELKMLDDFTKIGNGILQCNPYSDIKEHINIKGLLVFSEERGIRDPNQKFLPKTILNSSFNTFDSDRYLMLYDVWKMYDLATSTSFDGILIMCNTEKYGGGGIYNLYATTCADCADFEFITIHELGHSITGLADEYYSSEVSVEDYYPLHIEPWEPNITTLIEFDKKWKTMIEEDVPIPTPIEGYRGRIGVFEGAGYQAKGVYRPVVSCSMKDVVFNNFCPVCRQAITKMVLFYTK